ncbi:MAG: phasin family protein [Methyloligellaceae bacterium]
MSEEKTSDPLGLGRWNTFGAQNFEPFGAIWQGYFKTLSQMNSETSHFVAKRLEEDFRLPVEFAKCKTPFDVFQAQATFVDRMIDDYMDQANKVLAMTAEAAGETAETVDVAVKQTAESEKAQRTGAKAA